SCHRTRVRRCVATFRCEDVAYAGKIDRFASLPGRAFNGNSQERDCPRRQGRANGSATVDQADPPCFEMAGDRDRRDGGDRRGLGGRRDGLGGGVFGRGGGGGQI